MRSLAQSLKHPWRVVRVSCVSVSHSLIKILGFRGQCARASQDSPCSCGCRLSACIVGLGQRPLVPYLPFGTKGTSSLVQGRSGVRSGRPALSSGIDSSSFALLLIKSAWLREGPPFQRKCKTKQMIRVFCWALRVRSKTVHYRGRSPGILNLK